MNSLEDVFHPGASEVVGDRVHLVQSGLDGTAAQEVFRVHLVEVKGEFSNPVPLWLTEAREDLKHKQNVDDSDAEIWTFQTQKWLVCSASSPAVIT